MRLRLTLIALLALALRLWHLGARSLWLDEGVSIGIARMSWTEFFRILSIREANMSLYYLFLRGWSLLGDSEFFLRLASVLFGTAAILVFAIFVSRIADRFVATSTGFLLAISVLQIRYTREVRSYGLVLFLLALSWMFFERALRRGLRRDFVLWTLVSALAIYAHMFALLVVVAQLTCLAFAGITRDQFFRFARATAAGVVLISPLMVFSLTTQANPLSWIPPLSLASFRELLQDFSNGPLTQVAIACGLFLVAVAFLIRARSSDRLPLAVAVVGTLVPVGLTALISLHQPAFLSRYLIVALPSFLLAVSFALSRIPRPASCAVLAGMLLLSMGFLRNLYVEPAWNDFRDAAIWIDRKTHGSGDALIVWESLARPASDYYARHTPTDISPPQVVFPGRSPQLLAADLVVTPDLASLDRIAATYPRVFVLFDSSSEPAQYTIWQAFIVRRISLNHRMSGRYITPGYPGTQVLLFEPR